MKENSKRKMFTLPNHWERSLIEALNMIGKNGNPIHVMKCKINPSLPSFNKLQLEIVADDEQLLQLGVYIGTELAKPEVATISELEEKGKLPKTY